MFGIRRFWAALLILLLVPIVGAAKPAVINVRLGLHPDKTRVVLDLSEAPEYRIFTLPDPYRVVIDMTEVDWQLSAGNPPEGRGLVAALRYGLFAVGTSRLVLDAKGPVGIKLVDLLPGKGSTPTRLVIDLESVPESEFIRQSQGAPLISTPMMASLTSTFVPPPPKPMQSPPSTKPVIVIDAGHGGVDPGAIGTRGTTEKSITLAMAKELRRQLEETGRYKVVLTRDTDIFIRLRDRIAIARAAHGDLFVSLHADSHESSEPRGASVYTLSETASDAEAAALAAKENKADLIAGVDLSAENNIVTNILIDLAQRETKNLSAHFAAMLIDELGRDVRLLRNTHRFAGFAVLKAPDIASVLVETGYLSNPKDEALLRSADHRAKLCEALLRSIDSFFAWQETLRRS
ncbi:N-acetylmuramoyl-L-alanine amidase [Rhodospirillaceae bacterium SYSU D60014]|uniref:N-acetylmuramoyl-L-alanine amidase n=1 Tax=Virgifigura deserti TaxID=2268457 RepID=UPI0013C4D4CB